MLLAPLFLFATSFLAIPFDDVKKKEPSPKAAGKVYEWTSSDGLCYWYRIPKNYDPERGANLTFILHGSNLDHRWGFANHASKSFRPDDIVVSPDGTTPNGRGGFNFMGEKKDAKRLHTLHEELQEALNIRATYLYGHSQGSFFSFFYAGEYPTDVDGVVGHASGVWAWTKQSKKGHHQAIVLMHGTQDPVVSYSQSVGGYSSFEKAKYPMLRLRSLEGWNHWPAEHNGPIPHTSQQLAWCEGMTTEDPQRLEACWELLADVSSKARHDYAALYAVAERIVELDAASEKLKKKASDVKATIEKLAESHVKSMKVPKDAKGKFGVWAPHLSMFLRTFDGVPACDELAKSLRKTLESHRKKGIASLRKHYGAKRKGDIPEAFAEGVAALENGFLHYECEDRDFLKTMGQWREEAKKLKLSKNAVKAFDRIKFKDFVEKGAKAFDKVNSKVGKI